VRAASGAFEIMLVEPWTKVIGHPHERRYRPIGSPEAAMKRSPLDDELPTHERTFGI
jgi:hypothetical protein